MNEYTCIIKKDGRVLFECNTMAVSPGQAASRARYRYARQEVPEAKIKTFLAYLSRECTCTCTELPKAEFKKEPPKELKRVQLNLFGEEREQLDLFSDKLSHALDGLITGCNDDKT
jgi:hypothetical protein